MESRLTLAVLSVLFGASVHSATAVEFEVAVGQYVTKYCVGCHGADVQEGDFRIDTLANTPGTKDTALWAEVMERISSGEMPPDDAEERPTAEQGAAVVEWLATQIAAGEALRMAKRDRVNFYRLTREEYVHTVYDLLGVHYDATDPGGFSDDPDWHGFERIGSILTLSPSHIEKYFQAAETILNEAYPDKEVESIVILKEAAPQQRIGEPHRSRLEAEGLLDKVRFDLWPQDKHRYSNPGRLPASGVYECRIQLSGLKPANGRAPRLKFYHEKLDRVLFEEDVVAPEAEPTIITFQTHLPAGGQNVVVINDVPGPSNLPRSGRHGRKPFVSIANGRIPWQLKLTDEEGRALYPFLILDWAEWTGPIITEREKKLRAEYWPAEDGNFEQVRECLSNLARRAFRRPLHEGEVEKYVSIVEGEIAAGAPFRAAMRTGMLAILSSKSFLFIVEGSPSEDRRELNHWELATRLSYMLWGTMPDGILFDLAEQGKLNETDVLRGQVARMLADPRSKNFTQSFARQWLQLKRVGMFPPDAKLYPEYDSHLEESMISETTSFFHEVLMQDLTLREFLDSDWTMVNPRLADYYGIEGINDDRMQRVTLTPETHRGGLLTQASILSLTSDGQRHRPVHRGVWLSESILGKSPPPPPANVDPIEPNPVDAPKATLRMKLDTHKQNANCASCHRKIDPLGLAFENFDAIGRWRTHERVERGTGANPPVDASGELPDGRTFEGPDEFKQLLLADIDAFNKTFIRKLATFGLRRAMTFEDRQQIDELAQASKQSDYRVKSIVENLILSDLFRQR